MNQGDKIDDFIIQRLISDQGGFADVYDAICGKHSSTVVLKVLRLKGRVAAIPVQNRM